MRKITKFIVTLSSAACFALPFASCDRGEYLESPTGFNLDDNYNLTWSRVENARSYLLTIRNVETGVVTEVTSRRESHALSYLETGDYDIQIRATGDGSNFYDSEWSAVISLSRAYESGCRYQLINNGSEYEIAGVNAIETTELVLEDNYRGKPVTSIGSSAFRSARNLETLVIGKNVTSIGPSAFYNCVSLKNITIPDTVTSIGAEAFRACSALESFPVPAGVTELANSTFAYCRGLKEIDFKNVTVIGESAFDNCSALEEITISDSVTEIGNSAFASATELKEVTIGSGVTKIGTSAFSRCSALERVNFSESGSLKTISDKAFQLTALTSVALPEGLESFGMDTFNACASLDEVSIPDSVTVVGSNAFYNTKLYTDAVAAGEKLVYADDWLVSYVRARAEEEPNFDLTYESDPVEHFITTYKIRDNTVGIADRTFAATNVEDITLAPGIKYVGASAFNLCPSLYRFDASKSNIEILDMGAFAYSEHLRNVYLMPSDRNKTPTLTTIGDYAFHTCKALNFNSSATDNRFIPESVTRIGAFAFLDSGIYSKADEYGVVYADDWIVGCTGTYNFTTDGQIVPPAEEHANIVLKQGENGANAVRGISDYAFYNCMAIESFESASGIRSVGRGAFYNCTRLAGFAMTGLQTIDDYAFYNCRSIVVDRLPTRLRSIGRSAFYGCTMLDTVNMPNSLESIGDFAYYGCTNIKNVTFGSRLTEIGDYAFYGCNSLTSVTVPANIRKIGNSAFSNCTGIEELVLEEGVEEIGAYAFRSNESLLEINLPDSVKTVGNNAFLQCGSVEKINLGRVEHIGEYAFAEISGVTNLVVPDSVKTIGRGAFYYLGTVDADGEPLKSVQSVVIGGNIEKIDAHAFYGCNFATFFMEDENREADWGIGWNSSRRPAVWGVTLSEDKSYVVSLTVSENTFEYFDALNAPVAPYREGYEFAGWSLAQNGTEIAYTAQNVMNAPVGTVLYAVYMQK